MSSRPVWATQRAPVSLLKDGSQPQNNKNNDNKTLQSPLNISHFPNLVTSLCLCALVNKG